MCLVLFAIFSYMLANCLKHLAKIGCFANLFQHFLTSGCKLLCVESCMCCLCLMFVIVIPGQKRNFINLQDWFLVQSWRLIKFFFPRGWFFILRVWWCFHKSMSTALQVLLGRPWLTVQSPGTRAMRPCKCFVRAATLPGNLDVDSSMQFSLAVTWLTVTCQVQSTLIIFCGCSVVAQWAGKMWK